MVVQAVLGVLLLVGGAELLVRGGTSIALALRVPTLVVGLTIVAFGTSTPELSVSMTAAVQASTTMALANVIGSNIANLALVLGLAAMVRPIRVDRSLARREVPIAIGLQLLIPLLCLDHRLSRLDGLLLLAIGVLYNVWLVWGAMQRHAAVSEEDGAHGISGVTTKEVMWIVLGVVCLVGGSSWFVDGAVGIARSFELSERFVGLTVVALGTSAPEIATAVVSAYRGASDIAVGNAIGSNIFNVTLVLALTAMIFPIPMEGGAQWGDLGVAAVVTLTLIPMVQRARDVSRLEGLLLVVGYVAYLWFTPT